jgi:uncharacterized membrane protein
LPPLREEEVFDGEVPGNHGETTDLRQPYPPQDQTTPSGHRLEDVVGRVLRYGSLLSMAIILFGLAAVAWYAHVNPTHAVVLLPPLGKRAMNAPAALIARVEAGDPTAIISIGLLVLIATPVLRVASTVVFFFVKRDLTYLAITGFVLLVLITGFLLGSTAG